MTFCDMKGWCDVASATSGRVVALMIGIPLLLLVLAGITPAQTVGARAGTASAAGSAPATEKYVPPRTPDGQPDISGMYEPGSGGQPVETAVGGEWHPKPTKGGKTINPTDFGAGQAVANDPTIAHTERT